MSEDAMRARGMVVRAVVLSVDDSGDAQTVTVQTHDGVIRSDVEVLGIHGFASHPGDGATTLLLAVEGDQGNYFALPLQLPATRFGGLPPGGAVLYDDAGNRLLIPGDGSATLAVAALFRLLAQTVSIEAQGGTVFHGPVTFTDAVTFQDTATFAKDVTIGGALHVTGPVTGASFNGHS